MRKLSLFLAGSALLLLSSCCCDDEELTDLDEASVEVAEEGTGDDMEGTGDDTEGTGDDLEGADEPAVSPPGPCPKGTMCEDGCSCKCALDAAGRVVRKETDKKSDGTIEAVETHVYNEQGWLMQSQEDGSLWTKKAKVDGVPDQTWKYTYDASGNRLKHEVFKANGKLSTTCTYKKCPPPHESGICYKKLKCRP